MFKDYSIMFPISTQSIHLYSYNYNNQSKIKDEQKTVIDGQGHRQLLLNVSLENYNADCVIIEAGGHAGSWSKAMS